MMENDLLTPAQISFARKLAQKLHSDSGIIDIPISLPDIVKFLNLKNDVKVFPFPFTENVSGVILHSKTEATIGYNETQHEHRQRFTVAHEIGHFLMKHGLDPCLDKQREQEANAFAAELLMPQKLLKKDFKMAPKIDSLALKYLVSQQALCIHLRTCLAGMST